MKFETTLAADLQKGETEEQAIQFRLCFPPLFSPTTIIQSTKALHGTHMKILLFESVLVIKGKFQHPRLSHAQSVFLCERHSTPLPVCMPARLEGEERHLTAGCEASLIPMQTPPRPLGPFPVSTYSLGDDDARIPAEFPSPFFLLPKFFGDRRVGGRIWAVLWWWWILLLVEVELKSRGEGERLDFHQATFIPCNTARIS